MLYGVMEHGVMAYSVMEHGVVVYGVLEHVVIMYGIIICFRSLFKYELFSYWMKTAILKLKHF